MEQKDNEAAATKAPAKAKTGNPKTLATTKDSAQAKVAPVTPIGMPIKPNVTKVAETQIAVSKNPKTETKTPPKEAYKELVSKYTAMYPQCKAFHITTDMQVFLDGNLSDAFNHQREIGGGVVKTLTPTD